MFDPLLLVYFRQHGLHHNNTFALTGLPDICQIVDTLAPLVDKERRRFCVGRLDPRREQTTLVSLEKEELIEVSVSDFLHWLDIIARNQLVVRIEEFDSGLLERPLGQEQAFDTRQAYMSS